MPLAWIHKDGKWTQEYYRGRSDVPLNIIACKLELQATLNKWRERGVTVVDGNDYAFEAHRLHYLFTPKKHA